jgi:cytochrome c-type biogenesis protein CcmH/NrfG
LQAFNGRDYMSALDYWSRLCDLDANNARVAVLLRVAIARRSESDLGNDAAKVKNDRYIGRAMDALARQQAVLADRRDAREKNAVRERTIADFRTRALDLISEGNYKDSLKEWRKLLEVDPGNPTALLYEDILMRRARGEVRKK